MRDAQARLIAMMSNTKAFAPVVIRNPDRRWWQFWKPKTIYVGRPLPETTDTIRFRSANRYKFDPPA